MATKGIIRINPCAPNLVMDADGDLVGIVTKWNQHGLGECIVQFFDGSADSAIFSELEFHNGSQTARDFLDAGEPQ